PLFPS
ncbi:hypothetical protein N499_0282, partial [Wolbachia pipientis wVitA]